MPFNGNGIFNNVYSWVQDALNGLKISSTRMDTQFADIATALSDCVTRDGQSPATANLPMGGFKWTNVGAGSARGDSVNLGQVQDGTLVFAVGGGAVNVYTATLTPSPAEYTGGQTLTMVIPAATTNTGASTLNVNGLGAKAITKNGTVPLVGGELPAGQAVEFLYDGTQFQILNVYTVAASGYSLYQNLTFIASVSGGALTVALKGADGNDPSLGNPLVVPFRTTTLGSADYDPLTITAALSFTLNAGSSLGSVNNKPCQFWVVLFNDAGTPRLGLINCLSGLNIYPLSSCGLASSTAEGGGTATSAWTFYTATAVASKAFRVLGRLEYATPLVTAGTYAAAPDKACLLSHDTRMPSERVGKVKAQVSGGNTSKTAQIPWDNTIPQNTEGDAFSNVLDVSITPLSTANILRVRGLYHLSRTASTGVAFMVAIFQDSGANAIVAKAELSDVGGGSGGVGDYLALPIEWEQLAVLNVQTTFKFRGGTSSNSVAVILNHDATKSLGGLITSFTEVEEIQA